MTGKEALEKLLDTLKHWQGRNTIFDKIHSKHISDELELLEKYKRAFEILKDKLDIKILCENSFICNGAGYYRGLTLEEYELLEELMRDEIHS
jgi:hypothetical protein